MHFKNLTAALAMTLLIASGCSKNPASTETVSNPESLSAEFGGYTAAPEAVQFGDDGLTVLAADEVAAIDPMQANSEINSWQQLPGAGVYHLRFVWGHLSLDSTESVPTNWDGSLSTTRGALVGRRVIRFERGDYVKPRVNRQLIEWVSQTLPHNDGLAIDLIVPPVRPVIDTQIVIDSIGTDTTFDIDTIPPPPAVVTFATTPFSIELTERQLAQLDTIIDLGNGLSVAINSVRHLARHCPRGILAGQFGVTDSGRQVFRGIWLDPRGLAAGFFRGHFGLDSLGNNTFYGKWIDVSGNFKGLLRGRYEIRREGDSLHPRFFGKFAGGIFDAQGMPIGELGGRFRGSRELQGGFFEGRWKIHCPSDGVEPEDENLTI